MIDFIADYIGLFTFLLFFLIGFVIILIYLKTKNRQFLFLAIGFLAYSLAGWISVFIRLIKPELAVGTMLMVRTSKIIAYGFILYGFWRFKK